MQNLTKENYIFPKQKLQLKKIEKDKINRVLIFCGSFNPPTIGHLRVLEDIANHFSLLDQNIIGGYISPVNQKYKKKDLTVGDYRIEMCDLATKSSSWIMLDPWEALQDEYIRTKISLEHFQKEIDTILEKEKIEEKVKVSLVCGSDVIESMIAPDTFWIKEQVIELTKKFNIICGLRDTTADNLKEKISKSYLEPVQEYIHIIKTSPMSISSTMVRNLANKKLSFKYFVLDPVMDYILKNQLYI
ncbi:nicotinamide/nicotinic acid mononucleotide adenylyltransferase 2 [Anaeramoeba ignava]|uniref:Nicotinamide-nucleotide adenylyltransferase n=1 Tax=Anaeramoeba ignava TaxID=1746090 RepID=A0A9Q0RA04_ANAIG|nr:nicotinamide/nicotinic acid mononucleotide adenylyltransferase 2 [Anaeramoeba ignava]